MASVLKLQLCAMAALGGLIAAAPAAAQDEGGRRATVVPYLEVGQALVTDFEDETLTYSIVAAGIDASVQGRRAEGQISLRYERRIEWGDDIGDQDIFSGLARGAVQVVPNALSLEAGGIATRSSVDLRGARPTNFVGGSDNVTQVYSVYAGPTLSTRAGDVNVNAAYRIGYTKVESQDDIVLAAGQIPIDQFDDSVTQSATAAISQGPNEGSLPFGWAVSAGYAREDAGQLDQRYEDVYVRGDVTVPVSANVALLGGIGYEDIEISERDALRDASGDPVIGDDGRLVTDENSPRQLSFDQDGLIWDVGVLWRPSRRTSLEARYGRRYGSDTYYGTFSYTPSERLALSLNAYDVVTGFGSRLNDSLAGLPTSFTNSRNPLTGDIGRCTFAGTDGLCLDDALQSVNSAAFRTRGVTGQISAELGATDLAFAAGYNRRRFFSRNDGPLADANGVIDENWFAVLSAGRQLDERSSLDGSIYVNYLESGFDNGGDVFALGANAAYLRNITNRLSATAALGLDTFDQEGFDSQVIGSALLGLRYEF